MALFISSSNYNNTSRILPQAKLDGKAVYNFFDKHMKNNFDLYMSSDKTAE